MTKSPNKPVNFSHPVSYQRTCMPGFTLLEIMVVISIITVLSGMLILNLQDRDKSIQLENEAKRLNHIIELAREEAILNSEIIGLRFRQVCYTFVLRNDNEWKAYNDRTYGPHEIPGGIEFELLIDDIPNPLPREETPKHPQIIIWPSGELSPFELKLKSQVVNTTYSLSGKASGILELTREN